MKDIKLTERREEFYQRAISAPYNRNEDGLFILTVWIYATDAEIDMERCGSYRVVKAGETRFRSKAEAEEALRNYRISQLHSMHRIRFYARTQTTTQTRKMITSLIEPHKRDSARRMWIRRAEILRGYVIARIISPAPWWLCRPDA